MWMRFGLIAAVIALIAASWAYRTAMADALAPLPPPTHLACADKDCIMTIEPCRRDPIAGWNDSLYAAAKAPGVELRPCRATTDVALGD